MARKTSPSAAYSLNHNLFSHTGAVCRLREDNGDTEADFELDGIVLKRVSVGDTVSTWLTGASASNAFITTLYDQGASSRNATQTTTADQPLLVEGDADLGNCAEFDGSSDRLNFADAAITDLQDFAQFAAMKLVSAPAGLHLVFGSGFASSRRSYGGHSSSSWHGRVGNHAGSTAGTTDTSFHVMTLESNAGSYALRIDSSSVASNTHSVTEGGVSLGYGAISDGSAFGNFRVGEALCYDGALTGTELSDTETAIDDDYPPVDPGTIAKFGGRHRMFG